MRAQSDTIHQSIYDLIHSEDRDELRRQLDWAAFLRAHADDAACAAGVEEAGAAAPAHGSGAHTGSSGRQAARTRDKEQREQKQQGAAKSSGTPRPAHCSQAAPGATPDDPRATLNSGSHSPAMLYALHYRLQ